MFKARTKAFASWLGIVSGSLLFAAGVASAVTTVGLHIFTDGAVLTDGGLDSQSSQTLTIGGTTSTAVTIGGTAAAAISLTPTTAGTITIGKSSGTGAITLGSSSAAQVVNVATGTGTSTVNIGTGGSTTTITLGGGSGSTTSTITFRGHLISSQVTAPTFVVGGTGFLTTLGVLSGTDTKGTVSSTVGTGVGQITVNFSGAFASAPICVVSSAGAWTTSTWGGYYVTSSVNGFSINYNNTSLAAAQGVNWNYHCIQ